MYAPLKKKFLRHNNNSSKLSKLRNIFNKNRNYENRCKYKCQRNLCLNLKKKSYEKTKKSFYKNLDKKQASDNKVFWKNVKPSFSDKGVNFSKIALVEKKCDHSGWEQNCYLVRLWENTDQNNTKYEHFSQCD